MSDGDIVDRLRAQGLDAFAKKYSLGMWSLCCDAADEIERLRQRCDALEDTVSDLLLERLPELIEERQS